ncbi:DUF5518 domain-containing protein [Halopenitus sp. POP-27]|uniref:DUF5518 domain-containing protein n=1 Tax=Halopenitus sp. POP-27 TaxID=2994425 RepID=UPI0024699884|nr:DUF5518 domain-containing protein [Halopenitus sp. POP-27]
MDTDGNTLLNAAIGAIATTVLTWVPLSPIAGGILAGYLQGPDPEDGTIVGGLSGLFASVPSILILLVVLAFLPLVPDAVIGFSIAVLVILAILAILVYWVALSAIGGLLGSHLRTEIG